MKIVQRATYRISYLLLSAVLLLTCSACKGSAAHCYLCQGIPHDAPCVVDLSTGDIAELVVSSNRGAAAWQFVGDLLVTSDPDKAAITIPAEVREVNTALFCDTCLALIDETPNTGYILADLHDLQDVRLYAIEDGAHMTIRDYDVAVAAGEDGNLNVTVTIE